MKHKPYYTLIETKIGKDPAVVVVNSALRTFDGRHSFPWHLRVSIDCKLLGLNGMPAPEEVQILNRFEDEISGLLEADENAIFFARITARGQRILLYRIHNPEAANAKLQAFVAQKPSREWDFIMEHDSDWDLAQPELRLLERDPKFN